MAVKITKPKGTLDVLPQDSWKWQYVEKVMREVAGLFGYGEIRVPTFESTDLFSRGVGEGTDIVSKEMYTFLDKGGRSVTLRPEVTASTVRAVLENGLLASSPLPLKFYYIQSCYRYEKSQKGRYREFHQFGIECYGTHQPASDVEVISVAAMLLKKLGLGDLVTLEINSIGCPECRVKYYEKLREYFGGYAQLLCGNCQDRLQTNPMRLLDCKEEKCREIAKDAPEILDYLCDSCKEHFGQVQDILSQQGMKYIVNPRIVRGLDYYSNTVFEFTASGIGTQGTVCGGGRYNGLIEELGGAPTPAVGFGLGMERLLLLLEQNEKLPAPPSGPFVYAVSADEAGATAARRIVEKLRLQGISAECDLAGRSVKAQMKAAGRLGALYTTVLGQEEVASGIIRLKRMSDGAEVDVPLAVLTATIQHFRNHDPSAQDGADLQVLVDAIGPSVIFDAEEE